MIAPRRVMRSPSHFGTCPPCKGRSALPVRLVMNILFARVEHSMNRSGREPATRLRSLCRVEPRGSARRIPSACRTREGVPSRFYKGVHRINASATPRAHASDSSLMASVSTHGEAIEKGHGGASEATHPGLLRLALGSLGVDFGDMGTSPLYT